MVGSPGSPSMRDHPPRPMSAIVRPVRSLSRMSMSSRAGGSRASDEDGRTSVKVAVRVRPPLKATDPGYELIPQRFQKGMVHVTSPTSIAVDSPQGRKIFVFDRVFGESVKQEGVWEYLEESVSAFLQGYNVSLLAYGQSGAGKSYTMGTSGPNEQGNGKVMGVIPRAAQALFNMLGGSLGNRNSGIRAPVRYSTPIATLQRNNPDKGWTMKATYVEIYNESLRDLLLPEGTRPEERAPITVREDTKGRILLTGLRQVEINNVDDLLGALNFGSSIRQTDATAINAKSSRSHAVFSLNLVQRKMKHTDGDKASKRLSMPVDIGPEGFMTVDSKMHFVDLAGSERLKNTQAQGERAREGISINAGLASLGKVISQLSSRQSGSHVSYRDSKLTRLLQDSLGGNAITYMIACVTPAEFHLSETLNTIQYAQRARAIQSKPRIQQVSDDGDLKQLVDRLRAEIAFLREQLKNNSESSERVSKDTQGSRNGRTAEKEIELQNQLLDLQENYSALSQRHAKLISEITRARDVEEPPTSTTEYTDTAVDRLKRSNSFAEAVEQVVLEYEKTIQSLETSLTSTRSSLGNSESTLLEKESKLAYVETVNHQLQTRLQKMMDRESSTETYLHDLEAKLNGHTSGEEKNVAIIDELKNEIARVRENEAGCEDYISTLEERLAESEQDMELMQREIDRLEHVVDRQRSLGKLDGLLLELDSMKEKQTNGHDAKDHESDDTEASRPNSSKGRFGNVTDDEITDRSHAFSGTPPIQESPAEDEYVPRSFKEKKSANREDIRNNAVQSQVVTEKLEAVQKELLNLKLEHEQTIRDYEHMNINYEEALRNAASLQDQLDEMRHSKTLTVDGISRETSPPESPIQRPASFLVDGGMSVDLKNSTEQHSSSRSLSSELSLAVIPTDITYGDVIKLNLEAEAVKNASKEKEAMLLRELEQLRKEKEEALRIHEQEQEQLHSQLKTSLDQLADLRLRERINGVSSQLLRRKSSQSLAVIDRAQRAFMSLRRIASEHLGGEPDVLESFDLSLDGALRELLSRSERIQELENEVATLRRDMENKSTMIAGLTRERTSIQSSPMDISVVAVMERRIEENESLLHRAKLQLSERETELASARRALESRSGESQSEAVALLEELTQERKLSAERAAKVVDLQDEVEFIKAHQIQALRSLQQSKDSLEKTLQEIEGELLKTKEAATHHEQQVRETFDREMSDYRERVEGLQKTISENKQTIESQLSRIVELEESRTDAQRHIATQLANTTTSSGDEIKRQQQIITDLEHTISQNREDMTSQKARLDTLERDYDETIQQIDVLKEEKASALAALAESQERAMEEAKVVAAAHEELLATVRNELAESQYTITVHSNNIAALQASCDKAHSLIDKLENEKSYREEGQSDRSQTVEDLELQLADHKETIATHVATLKELQELQQRQELENNQLAEKEENYTKLLEDLEQQLTFTFDQNQNSVKKLDTLQEAYEKVKREHDELSVATELKTAESQKLIESLNDEISKLKAKLMEMEMELQELGPSRAQRSNSTSSNSNLRKSASTVSLPSPPPAIPLPPLPGAHPTSSSPPPGAVPSTMSRRPSKDYVSSHMEDQEARIKTLEKQLQAEKALTATLEEALTDCEKTMKRLTSDRDSFQAKASQVQQELEKTKNESQTSRYSMQAVEEERLARQKAEQARAQLEERMQALKQKNKRSFACF